MKIRHKLMLVTGIQLFVVLLHQTYIVNNIWKMHSHLQLTEVALNDLTSRLDFRFATVSFIDLKYDRILLRDTHSPDLVQAKADLEVKVQKLSRLKESSYREASNGTRTASIRDQYQKLMQLLALSEPMREAEEKSDHGQQAFLRLCRSSIKI